MSWFGFGKSNKKEEPQQKHKNTVRLMSGQFPCRSADEVLGTENNKANFNKIKSLISLPDVHYNLLVGDTIKRAAEHVQGIPATEKHHYAFPGGLIEHALEVLLLSLLVRRGFMLPLGAEPEVLAKKQELWSYAVLTAAFFKPLGPAIMQKDVLLINEQGKMVRLWQPLRESLYDFPAYEVKFRKDNQLSLGNKINPLLAQQLLPKEGMHWLASDQEVIGQWMSFLYGDRSGSGVLGQIIERAMKENILKATGQEGDISLFSEEGDEDTFGEDFLDDETFDFDDDNDNEEDESSAADFIRNLVEERRKEADKGGRKEKTDSQSDSSQLLQRISDAKKKEQISLFGTSNISAKNASEIPSDLGEFFVYWLKNELRAGNLPINEPRAPILYLPQGLLIVEPFAFRRFVQANSDIDTDEDAIVKRFIKLQLHKKRGQQNNQNFASSESGKRMVVRGYLIEDVANWIDPAKLPKPDKQYEEDYI